MIALMSTSMILTTTATPAGGPIAIIIAFVIIPLVLTVALATVIIIRHRREKADRYRASLGHHLIEFPGRR